MRHYVTVEYKDHEFCALTHGLSSECDSESYETKVVRCKLDPSLESDMLSTLEP